MTSIWRQCLAVARLNIASLPRRAAMSIASVGAIAMAVAVLLGFQALVNGFAQTQKGSGSESVVVVNRKGATSELSSVILSDQIAIMSEAPGIAMRGGKPLISGELYLIASGVKRSTGTDANMPLRGIGMEGLAIRQSAHIVEGRMFNPGAPEIVVGKGLLKEFSGYEVGKVVQMGPNRWTVVGMFEAPGTVFDSELWADARVVQSLFNRGNSFQVLRAQLTSPDQFPAFKAYFDNDPRLENFEVRTERAYYASQSAGTIGIVSVIGPALGGLMAFGALAGALNTMFSSVSARAAEIATLRIIGFSGFAAFFGTMVEAIALSLVGAVVGTLVCYAMFNGLTTSTLNGGFTQTVFQLQMSPALVVQGLIVAIVVGFIGGFFPGLRAATTKPQLELAAQ